MESTTWKKMAIHCADHGMDKISRSTTPEVSQSGWKFFDSYKFFDKSFDSSIFGIEFCSGP